MGRHQGRRHRRSDQGQRLIHPPTTGAEHVASVSPTNQVGDTTGGLIQARSLEVRYRGGALGVHDVSISAAAGTVLGLLGPNGAGKTTTVRAISGFLRTEGAKVTRGTVHLDGEDITNAEPHKVIRRGLAFVPERQKVFPALSVRDNILAIGRSLSAHERDA